MIVHDFSDSSKAVLENLRQFVEWDKGIPKKWTESFSVRESFARKNNKPPIWQFDDFPCLSIEKGSDLVNLI